MIFARVSVVYLGPIQRLAELLQPCSAGGSSALGVARCRRPGQFDERHDPPTGTVKLANDEALLLDVGQQTPCRAQRM
jgi:hypothetical protein